MRVKAKTSLAVWIVCFVLLASLGCEKRLTTFKQVYSGDALVDVEGQWASVRMYIDDKGRVLLLGKERGSPRLALYTIDVSGNVQRAQFLEGYHETAEGNLIAAAGRAVYYVDTSTFDLRVVDDLWLATLVKEKYGRQFFDSGLAVYLQGKGKGGQPTGIGIYDASTGTRMDAVFDKTYDGISIVGAWDEGVVVSTTETVWYEEDGSVTMGSPPSPKMVGKNTKLPRSSVKETLHLVTFKGESKENVHLPLFYRALEARGTKLGLIVGGISHWGFEESRFVVERYSYEGQPQQTFAIDERIGDWHLSIIERGAELVLVITRGNRENIAGKGVVGAAYIGYFNALTGERIYSWSDRKRAGSVWPLAEVGKYYTYPTYRGGEWEKASGPITLYEYGEQLASMQHNKVLKFAASSSGEYFAILTGEKMGIYSVSKDLLR